MNLTSYIVLYKRKGGKFTESDFVSVDPSQNAARVTGLGKFCEYTFRVLAVTIDGNGIASEPVTVSTDEDGTLNVVDTAERRGAVGMTRRVLC